MLDNEFLFISGKQNVFNSCIFDMKGDKAFYYLSLPRYSLIIELCGINSNGLLGPGLCLESHWPSNHVSHSYFLSYFSWNHNVSPIIWSYICDPHQILIHFVCLWKQFIMSWSNYTEVALAMHSICLSLSYNDVEVLLACQSLGQACRSLIKNSLIKGNIS